ncbi:MAG: hypothetical protein GY729_06240, partial [Desulfobacteraceae bacterium]|nr:hypothetical protein [Desulfobacteraceae bacterium]
MISLKSGVTSNGEFVVGIHKPAFCVKNLRENKHLAKLGKFEDGTVFNNTVNFPENDVVEPNADIIYEIPNAFAFRGTTYINSAWANKNALHPEKISIPEPPDCSLMQHMEQWCQNKNLKFDDPSDFFINLPQPLKLGLASASTDPEELMLLAKQSCDILFDEATGQPVGIGYKKKGNQAIADIKDHELFEVIVNNPYLPDIYKEVMVLRPGVQGSNEITAEYRSEDGRTHVFEYLRRNSYIPWGHFASNMANDAIRYRAKDLSFDDMKGIRHLYYQRTYVRIADQLGIPCPADRKTLSQKDLESLRKKILNALVSDPKPGLEF